MGKERKEVDQGKWPKMKHAKIGQRKWAKSS